MAHFQKRLVIFFVLAGILKIAVSTSPDYLYYHKKICMQLVQLFDECYQYQQVNYEGEPPNPRVEASIGGLKSFVSEDFLTATLKADLRLHYLHTSRLGVHSRGNTDLLTALYIKHLAALEAINFTNCASYAVYVKDSKLETACRDIAAYFAWFAGVNNVSILNGIRSWTLELPVDNECSKVTAAIEKIVYFVKTASKSRGTAAISDAHHPASSLEESSEKFCGAMWHPLSMQDISNDEDFFDAMMKNQDGALKNDIEMLKSFFNNLIYSGELSVVQITEIFDESFKKNIQLWSSVHDWVEKLQTRAREIGPHHASSIAELIREIEKQKLVILGTGAEDNSFARFKEAIESLHPQLALSRNLPTPQKQRAIMKILDEASAIDAGRRKKNIQGLHTDDELATSVDSILLTKQDIGIQV